MTDGLFRDWRPPISSPDVLIEIAAFNWQMGR
jgi:hypothetical protein